MSGAEGAEAEGADGDGAAADAAGARAELLVHCAAIQVPFYIFLADSGATIATVHVVTSNQ